MDIGSRIKLSGRLHKGVNKFVILLASSALLFQSQIKTVIQEILIIGPTVEYDGECSVWVDTRTQSSQYELGN